MEKLATQTNTFSSEKWLDSRTNYSKKPQSSPGLDEEVNIETANDTEARNIKLVVYLSTSQKFASFACIAEMKNLQLTLQAERDGLTSRKYIFDMPFEKQSTQRQRAETAEKKSFFASYRLTSYASWWTTTENGGGRTQGCQRLSTKNNRPCLKKSHKKTDSSF